MSNGTDPTSSTAAAFGRKTFVGFGAGAAAALSTAATGLAQTGMDLGKPHPPFVPESDPAIETARVPLKRPDVTLDAYAAWPKTLTPTTPSIVMVQHIWGVDSTIRDDVRRYAKAGFICIAPNLYERSDVPSGDGTSDINLFRPAAGALKDDLVMGDLLAARSWLLAKAPQAKIGITGFCMGGGIALKQLVGNTNYAAASVFYGPVKPESSASPATADPFAYAKSISTPVRGNYGERDTSIAAADVRTVFGEITGPHELTIYPEAGHAFFDDTRKAYVPTAATDAWTKTLAWFHRYLT